jgi:hypothetical protein
VVCTLFCTAHLFSSNDFQKQRYYSEIENEPSFIQLFSKSKTQDFPISFQFYGCFWGQMEISQFFLETKHIKTILQQNKFNFSGTRKVVFFCPFSKFYEHKKAHNPVFLVLKT